MVTATFGSRQKWCQMYFVLKNQVRSNQTSYFHLGTIHLRRQQIFTNFDPYPPAIGIQAKCLWRVFLILMYCECEGSDLLWEKIVLAIEKNFWNSRLKAENF